jgi:predicted CoA-substrate-specific enzyme activase
MAARIAAGVDAGSRATKVILLEAGSLEVIASGAVDQGVRQGEIARRQVVGVVATGYARAAIDFGDSTITEITCHARGVRHVVPDARSVIEIGGQDSKVLRLHPDGGVRDFAMNDRCAAGTGRFLEMVAARLEVGLGDLGEMGRRSRSPASISSMCMVFAETEIIGLLAEGTGAEDIAGGVQRSIASRITGLAGRALEPPIVFTGGVALVPGMASVLEAVLGSPVVVAPRPQMTGALGAALLAASGA